MQGGTLLPNNAFMSQYSFMSVGKKALLVATSMTPNSLQCVPAQGAPEVSAPLISSSASLAMA